MLRLFYRFCMIVVIVLSASVVRATNSDIEDYPDLFCSPGKTAGNNPTFSGKPISLFSGMETFSPSVDLSLGNIYPIRVTRSYNSRTSYDSPLGYGWAINYDKRLYTYADNSVTVRRECGGKRRFTWSAPTGKYTSQANDSGTLVLNADASFTYTDKNGESEMYDAQGRLLSMADAKGNSLVFTYTSALRELLVGLLPFNVDQSTALLVAYDYHLSKIEEKDASGALTGKAVNFHYDNLTGRVTDVTDSTSRTVNYGHDGIGNLTTVSSPNINSTYRYTDSSNRHLLTSIDEGNGEYINEFDTTGRVKKQTHGTGVIDFTYTTPYQETTVVTTIKDSVGTVLNTQTRTVNFDGNGMVIKVRDTNGDLTSYLRDSNTTWIQQEGRTEIATGITTTTAYSYDAKGNILTKTEADGTIIEKTTGYTYDPKYNLVTSETVSSVVFPNLVSTVTNSYDPANGNLLTRTEAGYLGDGSAYSYITTYTYYANGKLHAIDGPRTDVSDVTTYTYDPITGALATVIQPIIGTTAYSNFDALGNPQTVTDPNGNSTTYTYDTTGRVLTVTAAGDTSPTQYVYVPGGCSSCGGTNKIDHITLPVGNTIHYHYDDGMGNLTSIADDAGNSIIYTYDSEGNKLTEEIRDAGSILQKSLSYSYDALNRLSKITNPDNNYKQYVYDGFGNRKSVKDPIGNTTTYAYDPLNRLGTVTQPGTVTTTYGYNTGSSLASVKDANVNTTTYKYDDRSRVYQVISPDTGTTTYLYDAAGNMVSKSDAKETPISYHYDALNRLTTIDYPADTDTVYSYDTCLNGKGRLCSMTDASGTTSYEYTPKGQVKKETKTIDSVQYLTQYTYDMNGNLKTVTYPSGRLITYNYTNDKMVGVLNNAASLVTNISYKPFGGMSSLTYGNGLTGSISYDNQYRITGIAVGTVMNLSYPTYDANGNFTAITNTLDATKNTSFTYDALERLSTATASGIWGSLGWTYDGVGNRLTEGTNSYTYTAGTNKLASAKGLSYGFDGNGNTTAEGARTYTYNQNQRLIRVVDAGVTKGEYTYDGKGQRVKKVVNGVATIFHYLPNGLLIAESNSTGAVTAEYVYLKAQPIAKIEGTNVYYFLNDHLGTPRKMTDSSGQVVWSADYKPFGEATVIVSTITNNLRFPGQYFDVETGLHYNYFRDYNPAIGSYIEADRIGIQKGQNLLYVYVENNPMMNRDPRGLWKHGQYCGADWTGGQAEEYNPSHENIYTEPADALDACCKLHDMDYYKCRKNFPCSTKDRKDCMQSANKGLSICAGIVGGTDSYSVKYAMDNWGPNAGPDDPSCKQCKSSH